MPVPLTGIKSLIRERCGLSFDESRESILAEGIRTRQAKREISSHEAYLNLLCCDPEEFTRLINLITVKETYFFREAGQFDILTEELIPEIKQKISGRKIKIVCAGCSTGEEPYSVAIALASSFGDEFNRLFSITGFDIDKEALRKARAGLYAENSFRGVADHIKKKYFVKQDNGYGIADVIRRSVEFLHVNLFSGAFPYEVCGADVIFYRNVSIYLGTEEQHQIFRNLADMLSDRGYIFLGAAETYAHNIGALLLVERDGIFFYEKGLEMKIGDRRTAPVSRSGSDAGADRKVPAGKAGRMKKYTPERKSDEAHRLFDEALSSAEGRKYDNALKLIEQAIRMKPDFVKAYMLKAGILINLQRICDAEETCRSCMDLDPWCLELHILLGLTAKLRGHFEEAKKCFKTAVYIRPSCWLVHFYLGEIYRAEERNRDAYREFEIVISLLEGPAPEHGLTFFSMTFPLDQIAHLCRHNLRDIRQKWDSGDADGV